ncbi:MAG: DUF4003 domain-containing protein [Saccharofermentans sp.]|nr:DUF4003 domain-containing protein [Saccharofermentans sp.]
MKEKVLSKCDLLSRNRNIVHKAFVLESEFMALSGASILTVGGIEGNIERLKELEKLLKSNTHLFSEFRSYNKMPLVCKLATKSDPEAYLKKVQEIHETLQGRHWTGSDYRIIAALIIADHVGDSDYMKHIDRTNEIFDKMSKNHMWLTDNADIPFAATLAVTDRDIDQLIDDMERCYDILKKKFGQGNPLQSLTHILALQPEPSDYKCAKVVSLFDDLKKAKRSLGKSSELPTLGALCMLNMPNPAVVEIISEGEDFLKTKKGFGSFSMESATRRMFVAQMLLDEYTNTASTIDPVITSTMMAITMAIEACMLTAAIAASTAANSATY